MLFAVYILFYYIWNENHTLLKQPIRKKSLSFYYKKETNQAFTIYTITMQEPCMGLFSESFSQKNIPKKSFRMFL